MSFYEEVKELAGLKEDDEVTGIIVVLLFTLLLVPAVLGAFNFLGGEADELIEEATGVVEELEADEFDTLADDPVDADVESVEAEEEVVPTAVATSVPEPTAVPSSAETMQETAPRPKAPTINYVSGSRTETQISLDGTASAGEVVTIFANSVEVGTTTADEAGNWLITLPFDDSVAEYLYEVRGDVKGESPIIYRPAPSP